MLHQDKREEFIVAIDIQYGVRSLFASWPVSAAIVE